MGYYTYNHWLCQTRHSCCWVNITPTYSATINVIENCFSGCCKLLSLFKQFFCRFLFDWCDNLMSINSKFQKNILPFSFSVFLVLQHSIFRRFQFPKLEIRIVPFFCTFTCTTLLLLRIQENPKLFRRKGFMSFTALNCLV